MCVIPTGKSRLCPQIRQGQTFLNNREDRWDQCSQKYSGSDSDGVKATEESINHLVSLVFDLDVLVFLLDFQCDCTVSDDTYDFQEPATNKAVYTTNIVCVFFFLPA